ncbi:4Fe-4S binding protein [Vibrio splendidus]|uniref:4Fe-4S binding protein n=1 Tax=Vibrio splendidus TaxID=29497 RepID=UPI000C838161|nr:4Fe-4S binding protein [Vibrio splendidus]
MIRKDPNLIKESLKPKPLSRRNLFAGLASRSKQSLKASNGFIRACARPPSCAEESVLEDLCNGCGDCETACPQKVLRLIDGKPQLHLDCNYCTHCNACEKACSTGALSNTSTSTGVIPHISDSCQRMLFGQCQLCKESCQRQAIVIEGKKPTIAPERCNGCGECRSYCPFNSISFQIIKITSNDSKSNEDTAHL